MHTVHQPPGTGERPDGPRVTPYFTAVLESGGRPPRPAARGGLTVPAVPPSFPGGGPARTAARSQGHHAAMTAVSGADLGQLPAAAGRAGDELELAPPGPLPLMRGQPFLAGVAATPPHPRRRRPGTCPRAGSFRSTSRSSAGMAASFRGGCLIVTRRRPDGRAPERPAPAGRGPDRADAPAVRGRAGPAARLAWAYDWLRFELGHLARSKAPGAQGEAQRLMLDAAAELAARARQVNARSDAS